MTGHPSEEGGKKCWLPFELPVFALHFLSTCQSLPQSSQKGPGPEPAGSLCLLPLFTASTCPVLYFTFLCLLLRPVFLYVPPWEGF